MESRLLRNSEFTIQKLLTERGNFIKEIHNNIPFTEFMAKNPPKVFANSSHVLGMELH